MPEWALQLLVAGGGLTIIATAVGKVFNAWREDRRADKERKEATVRALQERADKLEAKVESLLMDAIADREETIKQLHGQNETNRKMLEVMAANSQALKEAATALAATKRPP